MIHERNHRGKFALGNYQVVHEMAKIPGHRHANDKLQQGSDQETKEGSNSRSKCDNGIVIGNNFTNEGADKRPDNNSDGSNP